MVVELQRLRDALPDTTMLYVTHDQSEALALAAGIAANITINPFEAMTTVTIKIVSQLTGDLDFTSPQSLVAFALGITLFVMTLILNVVALYIVRKYREQYD